MTIKNNASTLEKRKNKRVENDTLNVEIPLTIPYGKTIVNLVLDINERGLSFFLSSAEGYFSNGTILENIKIYNNKYEELIPRSKVAYCIKNYKEENGYFYNKIGLEFILNDKETKSLTLRKRSKRFNGKFFGDMNTKVVIENEASEKYNASFIDFSEYGISFSANKNGFIPQKSFILKKLEFLVNDEIIYKGKVLIIDVHEKRNRCIIRAKLVGSHMNIDKAVKLRMKTRIGQEEKIINEVFDDKIEISDEFKIILADTVYFLNKTKRILDEFEEEIKSNDSNDNKQKLVSSMCDMFEKKVYPKLDKYTDLLDELTNNISIEQHEVYKEYFQKSLHDILLTAPILKRIYEKPLGFPGDYEMMNMIDRNSFEGDTLFGKAIHNYICYKPPSHANRNRSEYMYNKIEEELSKKKNLKITSIASGPAIEIQKFILRNKKSNYCEITLLDFSREAIEYANKTLSEIIKKENRELDLHFIEESVFNLIRRKKSLDKINNEQDIIYSLGLFEYLNVSTCQKLLKSLYGKLTKGGIIVIGNYSKVSTLKSWMELGVEWYLNYRDDVELIELGNKIPGEKGFNIEQEKLGIIKFLVIKKR